jgi:hypothetical protein
MLIAVLFTVAKRWRQPKYPLIEDLDKIGLVHAKHKGIQPSKGGNATTLRTDIVLCEMGQLQKDTRCMIPFRFGTVTEGQRQSEVVIASG